MTQPFFYPVANERYAREIAEKWNVPENGAECWHGRLPSGFPIVTHAEESKRQAPPSRGGRKSLINESGKMARQSATSLRGGFLDRRSKRQGIVHIRGAERREPRLR